MKRNIFYIISGSFFFLLFIIFSYFVHQKTFIQFDSQTTIFLQNAIPHSFDSFFSWLSLLGSFEVCIVFLILLLILRRKLISGIVTLFLFGMTHAFELYGKTFVNHPGPPLKLLRYDLGFLFPSAFVKPGSS